MKLLIHIQKLTIVEWIVIVIILSIFGNWFCQEMGWF
jgi:hypothetical protein